MFLLLRRGLYLVLLAGLLVLIGLGYSWKKFIDSPLLMGKSQILLVPPGSSIFSVTNTLYSRGLIAHPRFFIILAKMNGQDKKLKAGEYQLDVGVTPKQLLIKLVEGKVILRHLTIVEGWTLKQVITSIKANRYLTHTMTNMSTSEMAARFKIGHESLEGYLYPDTYLFAAGTPDWVIIKKSVSNMQKKLASLWQDRAKNLIYKDPYSALIVASLIEKETARPEERAKVAGVIVRRLEKGMPLQIDASVIYGLGDSYSGRITHEDLKKDTPFNTYIHKGLPPSPIAMPCLHSIVASLHPEPGTALYYVARGNGTHQFSATLREHHEAVHRFRVKHLDIYDTMLTNTPFVPWFNNPNLNQLNLIFK